MARRSVPRGVALALIRLYQVSASSVIGRHCRYLPTCSDYAAEAIRRHGAWPGAWMGAARLCRCHPWGASGYDPVPRRCEAVPASRPWRHGRWRMPVVTALPTGGRPAEAGDQDRASSSAASP